MEQTIEQTSKEFAQELLYGKLKELTLPSGYKVTIREQNGADDDVLSNQVTAQDLTNINIFLSTLIIDTNLPFAVKGKLSIEGAKKIALRDKYFIIFASRIHSMGNIVKFKYDWGEELKGIVEYEDDLNNYVWDYEKPLPLEGEPDYYEYRIQPYDHALVYQIFTHTLKSGKTVRFNLLDGNSEAYLIKLSTDQQTKNTELKARNLELKTDTGWEKVENFQFFRKPEMVELHALVADLDPNFNGITELKHPTEKIIEKIQIIAVKDFFYPVEI